MKPIKRAVHIDFHTMPGVEDFSANMSGESIAQTLADAHVDYVNMFARCNLGFSYYNTKIGTKYPGFEGDLLGDTIRECHKRGIGVTAYINGGLNHQAMFNHPEFMRINKNGQVYEENPIMNHYYRSGCWNTGYRAYLMEEIKEVLELKPDGIFIDCMIQRPCYCPKCITKMKALGIDIDDDQAVFAYAVDLLHEVFAEIRDLVPKELRLYINSYPFEGMLEYQRHAEVECLPTYRWGFDFMPAQGPYHRCTAKGMDLIYMTGRMVTCWGDYSGSKPVAAMENDVYDALMYGYVPSMGDNMHPRDGLDQTLYRNLGKIYEYVMEMEPWVEGNVPATEVAILRNKICAENVLTPVSVSDKGVARMFSELKICYDVVNEDLDFSGYKLLVLPDNIKITDQLYAKLEQFEGSILSTGRSLRAGKVWDYIDSFEPDESTDPFYRYNGEVYGGRHAGVKMKSDCSISEYIAPYFDKHYDHIHGYFYITPDQPTGHSAIAKKGNRAHICFNIFESYMEFGALFYKELIKDLLKDLLPEQLIDGKELPSTARATLMRGEKGDILHIKVTFPEHWGDRGIIDEHIELPGGKTVSVMGEYREAVTLPDQKPVECCIENGRTLVTLPQIKGYLPILLKK